MDFLSNSPPYFIFQSAYDQSRIELPDYFVLKQDVQLHKRERKGSSSPVEEKLK